VSIQGIRDKIGRGGVLEIYLIPYGFCQENTLFEMGITQRLFPVGYDLQQKFQKLECREE
jgi:hypothetical protein